MPSGGVRLSGGPVLTDNEASMLESDVSSVIDISDHFVDTDFDDHLRDNHKYRLPDIGKTRLHLHTKEPWSPGPMHVPRSSPSTKETRENSSSTPTTPRTTPSATSAKMDFPPGWHLRNGSAENVGDSDFPARPSLSRTGSIYTLGRASFTGQLAQLTAMRLPDADSLAKRISDMATASEASQALLDAFEQIRVWISKASDVLDGLNAEDDVAWAAAGGREGIEDVDLAINRFQRLVEVFVESVERLQTRDDIIELPAEEIKAGVVQVETVIMSWKKIKDTLKGIKEQVEIAMEWEQLWNSVLGEIASELDGLNRLVFEMEEKRHQGAESLLSSRDSIDLSELETIVEEHPGRARQSVGARLSIQPFSLGSHMQTPPATTHHNKEDSSLLALLARMQPLRASLDFLPMTLSVWHVRGNPIFPSACIDLDSRREQLEAQWKKLELDVDSLRRELGEDRWVTVFRNAGRQALKMCESITRSFMKLKDSVDANEQATNPASLTTRLENYENKKRHYGPAIERVLAIIDRGVSDRLTVNGEILRLQSDMKRRWTALQSEMADVDAIVVDINNEMKENNLRDSVSTVISSERSIASSLVDTPGSSPASSVMGGSRRGSLGSRTPTPLTNIKTRSSSSAPKSRLPSSTSMQRKSLLPKSSFTEWMSASPRSSPSSIPTPSKQQPVWPSRPEPELGNKPRFVQLAKSDSRDFRPLSAYEPSPYAKAPVTPKTSFLRRTSRLDSVPTCRTPVPRIVSEPVARPQSSLPRPTTVMGTRKSSLPVPSSLATPSRLRQSLNKKASAPTLRSASRGMSGRRSSALPVPPLPPMVVDGHEADNESPSYHKIRPPSALDSGRRSSMLQSRARSRMDELSRPQQGLRPKWRP
ncbi:Hypothetical predicted protein [Lecanosticta acicola]|uniref:Karyogamy protein n=1 Tax=Lecanosticta acicola TaxID=111012 RepID=A0AAI8YYB4_9PEZI|nr:Hypothetical predicted protein [Lecanosticta acicola]